MSQNNVNHPDHYNSGNIECIDAMIAAFGEEAVATFCRLNAFKYLWRSENKGGREDIAKANWYLDKYMDLTWEKENNEKAVELPNV